MNKEKRKIHVRNCYPKMELYDDSIQIVEDGNGKNRVAYSKEEFKSPIGWGDHFQNKSKKIIANFPPNFFEEPLISYGGPHFYIEVNFINTRIPLEKFLEALVLCNDCEVIDLR
jgi:hypothetical protein